MLLEATPARTPAAGSEKKAEETFATPARRPQGAAESSERGSQSADTERQAKTAELLRQLPEAKGRLSNSLFRYFSPASQGGTPASSLGGSTPSQPTLSEVRKRKREEAAALTEKLEEKGRKLVEELGLFKDAVLVPPAAPKKATGGNKGGRPATGHTRGKKAGQKSNRRGVEQTKLKADLTAGARVVLTKQVQEALQAGMTLTKAKQTVAKKAGLSLQAVKTSLKKKDRYEQFLKESDRGLTSLRKQGSWKALRKLQSQAMGSRLPGQRGYLGTTDYCREIWLQTKAWAQEEEANGWPLARADVLTQFETQLEQALQQKEQEAREQPETLTEADKKQLAALRQKQKSLSTNRNARKKFGQVLLNRCGLTERATQRATALSSEEERVRLELSWRLWDTAIHGVCQADPEVLQDLVADPVSFADNCKQTALVFSDQIPVWLKTEQGKLLIADSKLKQAAVQSKIRRLNRKQRQENPAQVPELQTEPELNLMDNPDEDRPEAEAAESHPRTALPGPGQAPRWRVSLIARQAILKYFQPDETPQAVILPSVLVVFGQHCRLENISPAGTWLSDEKFLAGQKLVERKAGEKVPGNVMKGWRALRQTNPELFRHVKVWQQPAAVVDQVIYSWQQDLEATEHSQMIRQIDMFTAGWTDQIQQRNFLLQQIQTGIAAGCTPLSQITDIALAGQAKAAGRQEKEFLRQALRQAAREQGEQYPQYKCGPYEMMRVADRMHREMVRQNEEHNAVLRAGRQAGWLEYRPSSTPGKLALADKQPWALDLPARSQSISGEMRRNRRAYVQDGVPVPFSETELQSETLGAGLLTEPASNTFQQGELCLDMEPDFVGTEAEKAELEQRLLPVSQRAALLKAVVQQVTRQTTKKKKPHKLRTRAQRKELVRKWKERQGKKTAQETLKSMVLQGVNKAHQGRKQKARAGRKKQKGHKGGKQKQAKRQKAKSKQKGQAASGEAAASDSACPLAGKRVRVVGEAVPLHLQDLEGTAKRQRGESVLVQLSNKNEQWISQTSLVNCEEEEGRPAGFDRQLDLRKVTKAAKQKLADEQGGDLELLKTGQLLTDCDLQAGWAEILARMQTEDSDRIFWWPPAEAEAALQTDPHTPNLELQAQARRLSQSEAALVLAAVHSDQPRHWTLLVLRKQGGQQWEASWTDSLAMPSQQAFRQMQLAADLWRQAFEAVTPGSFPDSSLAGKQANALRQRDNWSCGLWTLAFAEKQVRQHLQEQTRATDSDVAGRLQRINKLIQAALPLMKPARAKARAEGKAKEAAREAAAQEAAQKEAAEEKSRKEAAEAEAKEAPKAAPKPRGRPPKAVPEVPLLLFGCPKCPKSKTGCYMCNPEKADRYAQKQALKQAAAEKAADAEAGGAAEASQAAEAGESGETGEGLLEAALTQLLQVKEEAEPEGSRDCSRDGSRDGSSFLFFF